MKCLRVRYSKLGKIRFVGHRDVARIWEELYETEIPLLYSQGFSPHQVSHLDWPCTGFESGQNMLTYTLMMTFLTSISKRL